MNIIHMKKCLVACGCFLHLKFNNLHRGHGGRVVMLSLPTSAAGVRSPSWTQVGKLVVACHWSAVYSTEP